MNATAEKLDRSPRAICHDVYKQYVDEDRDIAIKKAVESVRRNPELLEAALHYAFLSIAAYYKHRLGARIINHGIDDVSGIVAEIDRNMDFYDFPLPGGVRLGDATKVQLDVAIAEYVRQSRGMMSQVMWLRGIRSAMGKHKRVRNGVTLETIAGLRKKAETQADKAVG